MKKKGMEHLIYALVFIVIKKKLFFSRFICIVTNLEYLIFINYNIYYFSQKNSNIKLVEEEKNLLIIYLLIFFFHAL